MQIIIVGCGKVGYTLIEQLSGEEHNIIVIDHSATNLKKVSDTMDVMTILGNGASYNILTEADIEHTDLLVAVTGSDEQNLLCCLIAKKASNCKTIARVRNPVYNEDISFLKNEFGLAMIINPEQTAALEIAKILKYPYADNIDSFSKGKVDMIHFKIKEGSPLDNFPLLNIRNTLKCDVLVALVVRDNLPIIPKGDFVLQKNDNVSIIAEPGKANLFFKKIGSKTASINDVIIAGGGKITYYLAKRLIKLGISTKIIEIDKDRCEVLSELLPQANIIWGDGTDQTLLLEEGIQNAKGFISLTDLDEENLILSLFVKSVSNAKIITKINHINFYNVIEQLNIDSIVFPRFLTADYIVKYVRSMHESRNSNVENLYKIEDGNAEVLEFLIKDDSPVINTKLEDLNLKPNILISCINRSGKIIIPSGKDILLVGDTVIIVLTNRRIYDIKEILQD